MPRRVKAVIGAALLLILSYPPFDLGWLAWVALVPWLFSLEKITPRQAFLRSYLVGFFFFAGTIWWIGYVTIVGMMLLVAYLALYFALWGWLAQSAIRTKSTIALFGLPAAWVVLEYLRGILLTGFGWNLLAHTQWNWIPVIQIAELTGVYGVSFLVVLVNGALYLAVRDIRDKGVQGLAMVACLCLLAALCYGTVRLRQIDEPSQHSFKVAVAQGNIPQREKWDDAFGEAIWKRYETLTAQAAERHPDLIIWPETSVPGYLEESKVLGRLRQIVRTTQTFFLVGAPAGSPGEFEIFRRVYNGASLLSPDGTFLGRYDKIHLVPFGEYVPLEPVLGWLRNLVLMGDFSPGQWYTVFDFPRTTNVTAPPFSVLICFEDLFPGLSRRFVRDGAQWLIVITNDAWFGRSAASLQHLQASVFRAVEQRVWVARAANTGWSGFVDPAGRRLGPPHQVPRFRPGVATATLSVSLQRTPYNRWGDWFLIFCGIIWCLALFKVLR